MNLPGSKTISRRGVSLIEVITCTMLVAVLLVPLAAVIRASGQSIAEAEASTSTEAELRRGLRWLGDTIRDGDLISVRTNRIQLRMCSGEVGNVRVRGKTLEFQNGKDNLPIANQVLEARFTELRQATPPKKRIGLLMSLRARDPDSGATIVLDSTLAIPPQG